MIGLSAILKVGNENSGNHGHSGRPGERGGSGDGGGSSWKDGKTSGECITNIQQSFNIKKVDLNTTLDKKELIKVTNAIGNRFQKIKEMCNDRLFKTLIKGLYLSDSILDNHKLAEGVLARYDDKKDIIHIGTFPELDKTSRFSEDRIADTVAHELGHHIYDTQILNKEEFEKIPDKLGYKAICSGISNYAGTTYDECFSESFRIWTNPNYNKGDLPKSVENFFNKNLGKTKKYLSANIQSKKKKFGLASILKYGTASSGNYGHSGRLGEVGGSGDGGGSNPEEKDLKEGIKTIADMMSPSSSDDWKYKGPADLILSTGSFYTPSTLPKGVEIGEAECFTNAATLALGSGGKYTYVEGFASHEELGAHPIEHAWCIDSKGKVVDNTWETSGSAYFGVAFKTSFVKEMYEENGVLGGFIPDNPTEEYNPFKEGFPEGALKKSFTKKHISVNIQKQWKEYLHG